MAIRVEKWWGGPLGSRGVTGGWRQAGVRARGTKAEASGLIYCSHSVRGTHMHALKPAPAMESRSNETNGSAQRAKQEGEEMVVG